MVFIPLFFRKINKQNMPKILLVEDEKELADVIRDWLSEDFHLVETATDGHEALRRLSDSTYDLIILDLMLPVISGMDVCRQYRSNGGSTPILMLTAKHSLNAKEAGLDAGADDYLTKPFELRELSARARALLRRYKSSPISVLAAGDLSLDRNSCRVTKNGEEVHFLPKEYALLELLMRNQGTVLSVDVLLDNVWGKQSEVVPDTVRSYIKTLRKKVDTEGKPSIIRTVHGIGYVIDL
jgi:DNA-binding response OmpR family regulator